MEMGMEMWLERPRAKKAVIVIAADQDVLTPICLLRGCRPPPAPQPFLHILLSAAGRELQNPDPHP